MEKGKIIRKQSNALSTKFETEIDSASFSACSKSSFFKRNFTDDTSKKERIRLSRKISYFEKRASNLDNEIKLINSKLDDIKPKMDKCLSEARVIKETETYYE